MAGAALGLGQQDPHHRGLPSGGNQHGAAPQLLLTSSPLLFIFSPPYLHTSLPHFPTQVAPPDKDYLSTFHGVFRGLGVSEEVERAEEEDRRIEIVNKITIPESEGMAVMLAVIKVVATTAWQVGSKSGFMYCQDLRQPDSLKINPDY